MKSPVLFYSSAGNRIKGLSWLNEAKAIGDVALAYYGNDDELSMDGVKYFLRRKDYKFPNFLYLLRQEPSIFDYDTFVFIDDDIEIPPGELRRWLECANADRLDVSQPSLTVDSKSDWPHLKNQPGLSTDTPQFVEIQCFALSRRALREALPYFFMVRTGTGLDVAMYHLCIARGLKAGVVHQVQVRHPHRPETETVRRDFDSFAQFNKEMNHFLRFCFDGPNLYLSLADASRILGDTRPNVVRFVGTARFVLARATRVIRRFLQRSLKSVKPS